MEAMNSEIIGRIFSALQSLEKCMLTVKEAVGNDKEYAELAHLVPQQTKVLVQMRRTANKLQLQFARSEWDEVVRSMKIFYGLNHMVRMDILTMFGIVSSKKNAHLAAKFQGTKQAPCH